jgi:hypothetical protein
MTPLSTGIARFSKQRKRRTVGITTSLIFDGPGSSTEGVYSVNVPVSAGIVAIECHGEGKGNAGGFAQGSFSGLAGLTLTVKIGGGGAGAASNGERFSRPAEAGRGGHYAGVFSAPVSLTYTAASENTYPTQNYGWYTRSGGAESNPYSGIRQLVIRWNGVTVYDGSGVGSGGVTVGNYTYYPSTYRGSIYGWSSDFNNAFDIYRVDNTIGAVSQASALVIAGGSGSGNFADVQQGGIGGGPSGFNGNSSSGTGGGPSPFRAGGQGGTQSAGGAGGPGYEGAGGTGSALQGGSGYNSDIARSSGGAGGGGYFGGGGGGSGYDSGNYASGAGGGGGSGYVSPSAVSAPSGLGLANPGVQNNAGGSLYPQGRVVIYF